MADIRIVAEVVGANKVNALVNSTKKLEGQVKNLGNAYLSGKIGPEQFNKGLTELRKSANALYPTHQKASAVVTKLARDYVTLTQAQQQDIAATKAYIQARREATAMNQRFNQEKKLEELRVKQATQSLNAYTAASRASTIANKGNVKGTNNLGVIMQQTGYQVGDFAIQVQGGTNIAVAFGQQATQLVGALYLLPAPLLAAKVGILGLSISVTALIASFSIILPIVTGVVAYFMRSAKSARESADGVETLDDRLKSLNNTLREWNRAKQAAALGITGDQLLGSEGLEQANKRLDEATKKLERLNAIARFGGLEGAATAFLLGGFFAESNQEAAQKEYLDALETVRQIEEKLADEQLKNFGERYVLLQQEIALEQERLQFGKDSAQAQKLELEQRILNMQKAIDEQVRANEITAYQGQLLKEAEEAAMRLAAQVDASKDSAEGLAGALRDAAKAMSDLMDTGDLDAKLSGLTARINALRTGGNASSAGYVATETAKAMQDRDLALSANTIPTSAINTAFSERIAKINQAGALMAEEDALQAAQREAKKAVKESPLEKLQKELDLQRELVGQSEAYVKVRQALGDDYAETSPKIISDLQAQYAETQKLIEIEEQRQSIIGKVESSMENAFMSMVDGTASVKDAFKSMAAEIIKELYRVLVVQQIVNSAKTAMGSFFADGGAFSGGSEVKAYANGGVVGGPTYFPMSGGKTGLMGEAGPEAIMPLKRGSNGKLGVSVEGGSGSVVVNNNINVTGGSDPAAIRMEVAKLMPQITSATKSAVIDARRRGGQMKAAFG
jgi:hypothetical protein